MSDFEESSIPRHHDADQQGEPVVTREPYKWKDGIERIPRPMDKYLPAVLEQLASNQVIVVQAETGTGKTSRIPQAILDSDPEANIIMTQLTRPAVAWNGQHISGEMGSRPGGKVGWRLRGEDPVVSSETRCQLVIDQSLVNKIIADGRLPKGVLIIDEAHVRSIQTDLLLSLVKEYLPKSPDTRIVITSATIDTKKFQGFFNTPEPITAYNEHMHPIETDVVRLGKFEHHTEGAIRAMREHVLDRFAAGSLTVQNTDDLAGERKAVTQGSVLMLLPGKDDINQAMRQVQAHTKRLGIEDRVEIVQCHSQITPEERARVAAQTRPGVLRIVCATDILRSSVTVPDTIGVVDSLQVKRKTVSERGVSHLAKVTVSGAEADQGKGRAGREGPGFYIPVSFGTEYEHITNKQNSEYWPVPAIMRESLSSVTLQIAASGLDIRTLDMMDKPDAQKISVTLDRLKWIGAMDDDGKITDLGRKLERLTIDPERGRVLFEAAERGVLPEAIIAMSVLENEGIFHVPGKMAEKMTVDREIMYGIHLRQLRSKSTWTYPAQTPEEVEETARTTIPTWAIPNSDGTYTLQFRGEGFPYEETPKSIAQKVIKRFAGDTRSDFYAVVQAARAYRQEEERLEAEFDSKGLPGNRDRWVGDNLRTWCFTNCINVKSMERTISSIRELSTDLRGSEFELSTPPSAHREFSNDDLTKSMLLGLLDGIAVKDEYSKYKGPRGSGIAISSSSCCYSDNQPQIALCESVKKPDTPVRGVSYFSSMVAPIKQSWLEEVLPDLCKRTISADGYAYDSATGSLTATETFTFNSEYKLPSSQIEATGEVATEALASLLARSYTLQPEIYAHNMQVLSKWESLQLRGGDRVRAIPSTRQEFLRGWYRQKLEGIQAKQEFDEAISDGRLSLKISLDEFVTPEIQTQVLMAAPDEIVLGGEPYPLSYVSDGIGGFRTTVSISAERLFELGDLPTLPSGDPIRIAIKNNFGSHALRYEETLEELKAAVRRDVTDRFWENRPWRYETKIIPVLDLAAEVPRLEPLEYGTDPQTGETLLAYPAIAPFYDEFRVTYHRTQGDADVAGQAFARLQEEARRKKIAADDPSIRARVEELKDIVETKLELMTQAEAARNGMSNGAYAELRSKANQAKAALDTDPLLSETLFQEVRVSLEQTIQLAEKVKSGEILVRFGGGSNTSGTGQKNYWVVAADGSLREPDDTIYGSRIWNIVQPEELALEWRKQYTAEPHNCTVSKMPTTGVTAAQQATVAQLQRELDAKFEGSRGFSSGDASPPIGRGWGLLGEADDVFTRIDTPTPAPTVDAFTRIDTSTPAPTVDALRRQIESLLGWAEGLDKMLLQTQLGSLGPDMSENDLREAKVFIDGLVRRLPPPMTQNHTAVRVESKPRVFVTAPLEGDSIEALTGKVLDNAKKNPSLRRKAIAALAGRGLDGIEALERLGMTSADTLATVRKQEFGSVKDIGRYQLFIQGASLPVVREYLGEDASAISEFRRRLYEDISSREKVPQESEIGEIVEGIIEDMTR